MNWLGKITLGALGFALRGPAGAIAGALLGAIFDHAPEEWKRIFTPSAVDDESVAEYALLGLVAFCDGGLNDEELKAFAAILDRKQVHEDARVQATAIFNIAGRSAYTLEQLAVSYFRLVNYEDEKLFLMMESLLEMAATDGPINRHEDRALRSTAEIFLIGRDKFASMRGRYKTASNSGGYGAGRPAEGLAKCYETLNVSPSDSDETIKKRYRKLVADFHPDKIASKELPEEFTKFANQKLAEINQAYDAICKSRGVS
ncbi:MAG: TerB family tellurite resistance protein [Nitrospinota bacterium]|nr:TerB family tellurite resistance protein [Nitrospinota bacterium]